MTELHPHSISAKGWQQLPVATATTRSGATYSSGGFISSTRIGSITAEQAAVAVATACGDPWVVQVHSNAENDAHKPQVLQTLAQHSARTSLPLDWQLSWSGKTDEGSSSITDVRSALASIGWAPQAETPPEWAGIQPTGCRVAHDAAQPLLPQLQAAAQLGMARATTTPSARRTAYGAAVLGDNGYIYYAGQYTALGLHAEMAATLAAFAHGARSITHLALASTKHTDDTCECCGICRQFLAEVAQGTGVSPAIIRIASGTGHTSEATLDAYLPHHWRN